MDNIVWGIITFCVTLAAAQNNGQFQSAFSAALSHHLVLTGGENIVYDTVFTNIGNVYDSTTGKFTCPLDGIYVFQFHGLSKSNQILYLELYHNQNYVASAYSHTDSDWAAAGNDVVLHLNKGDTVYVKDADGQASQLYGDNGELYCTFSGYLISPYFEENVVVG